MVDDRRMMLVDRQGRFVSARRHAELARVELAPTESGWEVSHPHPGHEPLRFDCRPGDLVEVQVWGDRFLARLMSPDAASWFSELLGLELRLVMQAPETRRSLDAEFADPRRETVFADGYPLLVASEASLRELNAELDSPIDMLRLRPNIVVDGELPWAEDEWESLEIGELTFRCAKACERCTLTGVDPASAERGPEPLRTIVRLRKDKSFGVNLVHSGLGEIAVGQEVRVSTRPTR
jgi:uncharacterized protein YcbX